MMHQTEVWGVETEEDPVRYIYITFKQTPIDLIPGEECIEFPLHKAFKSKNKAITHISKCKKCNTFQRMEVL